MKSWRKCYSCDYGYEETYRDGYYLGRFWCTRFPEWIMIDDKMHHFCGEWRSEYE